MTTDVPLSVRTPSPLGEFLRARRHELAPEEVGIKRAKGRRRVGLSRTEVAELANISVAYYDLIERGRDLRPSKSVIDGLARALKLDSDGRSHLHALATGTPSRRPQAPEELTEELEELLDSIEPNPAYVVGARWDVLGRQPHRVPALHGLGEQAEQARAQPAVVLLLRPGRAQPLRRLGAGGGRPARALPRGVRPAPRRPGVQADPRRDLQVEPRDRRVVGAPRHRPDPGPHQADPSRQRAGDPAAPARAPGARRARHPGHQLLRRRRRRPRRHRVRRVVSGGACRRGCG